MRSTSAALRPPHEQREPLQPSPDRPHAADAPCAYEIVTTRAGFDALRDEWDALFERAGKGAQLFQTFSWLWHWCNSYLPPDGAAGPGLAILTGRRNGKLVTIWPTVIERHGGLDQLAWMGAPVSQYGDILIDDVPDAPAVLRDGWNHLVETLRPDIVWLTRVRADAAIASMLADIGARATQRLEAPYLDLTSAPDFDSYMLRHSSRARKKHRAAARKLAAHGAVEFVCDRQTERAQSLASTAVERKNNQLLEKGIVSPALTDPRTQRFFADAAGPSACPSGIVVYALEVNGERAAIDVLVTAKQHIATHVFAYDPKYAKDRVGAHLLELTIERTFSEGYTTLDMLAPADDYKLRWADGTVEVTDWAVPVSRLGSAYMRGYLETLRPILKTVRDWMPPAMAKVLAAAYARLRA